MRIPRRAVRVLGCGLVVGLLGSCSSTSAEEGEERRAEIVDHAGEPVDESTDYETAVGLDYLVRADLVVTVSGAKDLGRRVREGGNGEEVAVFGLQGVEEHVVGVRVRGGWNEVDELKVEAFVEDGHPFLSADELVGPYLLIGVPDETESATTPRGTTLRLTIEITAEGAVLSGASAERNAELTRFLDSIVSSGLAKDRRAALLAWMTERAARRPTPGPITQAYFAFYRSEHPVSPPTTEDPYPPIPLILETDGFPTDEVEAIGLHGDADRDLYAVTSRSGSGTDVVGRAPSERWTVYWMDWQGDAHDIGSFDPNGPGLEAGIRVRVHGGDKPRFEVSGADFADWVDFRPSSTNTTVIIGDPG